jgi:hypothetical protein
MNVSHLDDLERNDDRLRTPVTTISPVVPIWAGARGKASMSLSSPLSPPKKNRNQSPRNYPAVATAYGRIPEEKAPWALMIHFDSGVKGISGMSKELSNRGFLVSELNRSNMRQRDGSLLIAGLLACQRVILSLLSCKEQV